MNDDSRIVRVPDIGDFDEVDVIEVHVAEGDEIAAEDPIVTLETDKASMDLPAPRGGRVESVTVAEDGTTVNLTEVADLELGKVATKFPRAMLKGLVVRNMSGQCYDVTTSGRTGIPAGSYSIVYGVLARGRDYAFLLPPETTYDIQAGGTNTLKLGPEFTLTFSASFSGGKVNIGTGTGVMGAGSERYRFSEAPDKPYAYFFVGKRKVAGGAFSKG